MINSQRIAGLLLLVLLSQQALASMRVVTSALYSPSCTHHISHESMHHCHTIDQSSHHMVAAGMLMADHKGMDGIHCEHCVSGCQPLVFSLSVLVPIRQVIAYASPEYSQWMPVAPAHSVYRPPITV